MGKQSDVQETGGAASGTQNQTQQGNEAAASKKKSNKPVIIFFILVIAALVGVIVWLLFFKNSDDVTDDDRLVLVNESNKDTVMRELDEKVAKGMFECKMSMKWNFTDGGQGSSDAYVANSEHNTYAIYFDVIDNETGETLFSSPYIMVGSDISGFLLDKKLSAGQHEATVMYTLVDQDNDFEKISSAGFVVTMNVAD